MKDQKKDWRHYFHLTFLTYFGVGYAPMAPGTVASFATLPILFCLGSMQTPWWMIVIATTLLTLYACYAADKVQRTVRAADPQWIVLDEVIGMLITYLGVMSNDLYKLTVVFVLFRFFDIVKIWPASYFDKKVKNGAGTILDDVVSAAYAGVLAWMIDQFLLRPASIALTF